MYGADSRSDHGWSDVGHTGDHWGVVLFEHYSGRRRGSLTPVATDWHADARARRRGSVARVQFGRAGRNAAIVGVRWAPALAGGVAAALAAPAGTSAVSFGALVVGVLAVMAHAVRALALPHRTLPAVRALQPLAPGLLTVALLYQAGVAGVGPGLSMGTAAVIVLFSGLVGMVLMAAESAWLKPRPERIGVIGPNLEAHNLSVELSHAGCSEFEVVGYVRTCDSAEEEHMATGVARLGDLDDIGRIVRDWRLDLLLVASGAPRIDVFRQLAETCPPDARALELTAFYERTLGHVPVGAINDAWFQCVMHPEWAGTSRFARVRDLVIAFTVAVLTAPLMAVLALLIRLDGGPVIYRQKRIGEGGRPFEMYKLRSMSVQQDPTAIWSAAGDDRVTAVGRFMRRTHLDELPQVLNVLRGEMSIVGPRPEQPEIVERLEDAIPFYRRRHLTRPGITGWAQVHCGYAGSESGSAWKLSHDLYYIRHRSELLDLMILLETVRTFFADPQYTAAPAGLRFVLPDGVSMSEAA